MLHSILKLAVDDRLIPENPARGTELPKVPLRSHPYLTRAELIELADAIDPRYRALILTLGLTGLRFGEAAALKKRVYSPERRRIRVELSVTENQGVLVWGPPKNQELRTVALPSSLAELVTKQARGLGPDDLIFTSARGEVLRLNTWRARAFARALDTADERREVAAAATGTMFEPFPRLTPHDLRHTAASLAVQAGANVKSVQTMLGHASAAMTLDTYADLFDSELDALADRMDGPLSLETAP
jgi:integrase